MKRINRVFYKKLRMFCILCCVFLSAAVFVCCRGTDSSDRNNSSDNSENSDGNDISDSSDSSDGSGSSDIGMEDITSIITRDQLYFVCRPFIEDETYDHALVEWKKMNYGKAYKLLMEIVEERESKYTKEDYETAAVNNTLGCLCLDMGKHEEGFEYLNSAYVAVKKLYGEDGVPALAVLSNIVDYDYVTGRLEQCQEDAQTVVSAKPPLPIWVVVNRIQMLVNYECSKYEEAIRGTYLMMNTYMKEQNESFTWDDMLSLQDHLNRQDTYDSFTYHILALLSLDIANSYAVTSADEKAGKEAEKWYETGLFICQNRIGEQARGVLAKINAAYAYFLKKCSLMEGTINIQEDFGDSEFPCIDLVETYGKYGDMLFFIQNEPEDALKYYKKARDLSEYIYGVNHIRTARAYFNLGKYYIMLNEDEKALKNLKMCEQIKKDILLLKDKDTIDLYTYLAVVYKIQEKHELADNYRNRADTIIEYLGLHKADASDKTASDETASDETVKEASKTRLDLSKYKDGGEWQHVIRDYISALQARDADMLMDTLQLKFLELTPIIISKELGVTLESEKLRTLYTDFYQEELLSLHHDLTERYGEEYRIRFEPYEVEYVSEHDINVTNDYLFTQYDSEIVVENMVNITGQFWASGTEGAESGKESEGFLCSKLVMIKAGRQWKLGISDGFPQMPQDMLKDFLGIETDYVLWTEKNP